MNNNRPLISIIMPVYDGERYLPEAIESVLAQTYQEFEFLIVDDGSTDNSPAIIYQYSQKDPRIQSIQNPRNLGIAASLNKAISASKGVYIARMDADDIAYPERLEKQISYLEANPQIGFCGTWVRLSERSDGTICRYPEADDAIRCRMIFSNCIAHSTVIFRRQLFLDNGLLYDQDILYAQDYDLWSRALQLTQAGNCPEALLSYRIHEKQIGSKSIDRQTVYAKAIRRKMLRKFPVEISEHELAVHELLCSSAEITKTVDIIDIERWLNKLIKANSISHIFNHRVFSDEVSNRWEAACNRTKLSGRWLLLVMRSPIPLHGNGVFHRLMYILRRVKRNLFA